MTIPPDQPQDSSGAGYGQPGGYGPPGTYGQPGGYGQPGAYGQPGGMPELATWPLRVGSALIDWVAPFVVAGAFFTISRQLGSLLYLVAVGWVFFQAYRGGATGQSLGKKVVGTRLLREQDGQVIGGGLGIGRQFLHIVDGIPCYIGYLWPLWDAKRQTFADKIVKSVVVKA